VQLFPQWEKKRKKKIFRVSNPNSTRGWWGDGGVGFWHTTRKRGTYYIK
jgi:hypothetical protein